MGVPRFRADLAHPEHPTLTDRKRLVWRLAVLRNLILRTEEAAADERSRLNDLASAVLAAAEVTIKNDHEQLDDFLSAAIKTMQGLAAKMVNAAGPSKKRIRSLLRTAIGNVRDETKAINCAGCSKARQGGPICNGSLNDERALEGSDDKGPPCWRLLTELFSEILEIAEDEYGPFIAACGQRQLAVKFCTRRAKDRDVGAKALFPDDDSEQRRVTEITLALPPHGLHHTHIRDLPYVLFHEVFVHSVEGWVTKGCRLETTELCAFREGFVDAAAAHVLEQRLLNPGLRSGLHRSYSEIFSRGVRTGHANRMTYNVTRNGLSADEAVQMEQILKARNRGWKLFRRLEAKLQGGAVRLAICLNLLDLPHEARQALVAVLDRASDPEALALRRRTAWFDELVAAADRCEVNLAQPLVMKQLSATEF
jgi:hypothetical protein